MAKFKKAEDLTSGADDAVEFDLDAADETNDVDNDDVVAKFDVNASQSEAPAAALPAPAAEPAQGWFDSFNPFSSLFSSGSSSQPSVNPAPAPAPKAPELSKAEGKKEEVGAPAPALFNQYGNASNPAAVNSSAAVKPQAGEAPKAEAPKTDAKKPEAPKAAAPKAEAPKAAAPKAEAPKAEAPKAEAPKAEAPKAEAPKAEAPKAAAGKAKADQEEWPIGGFYNDAPKADAPKAAEAPQPVNEKMERLMQRGFLRKKG